MTSVLDPETMAALQRRFAESPAGGPVVMRPEDHGAIPSSAQLASMDPVGRMDSRKRFQVAAGLDETPVEGGTRVPPAGITSGQRSQLAERFAPVNIASGAGPLLGLANQEGARAESTRSRIADVTGERLRANKMELEGRLLTNEEARAQAQAQLESSLAELQTQGEALEQAKMAREVAKKKLAHVKEFAAYGNMSRSEFDRAKATLADEDASAQAKLAAERALQRGRELDAGAWMGEEPWMRVLVGLGMAIAAGMEGYAAGLQGRASNSHKIIQDAIDRGLAQEKAKFAKHRESMMGEAGYFADLVEQFDGDVDAAEIAFKVAGNQAAIARGDLAAAQRGDREAMIGWQKTRADLLQEQLELEEKLAARHENHAFSARLAAGQLQAQAAQKQSVMNAQRGPGGISPELVVPGAEFSGEKMPTKKDAELVNKARAATVDAVSKIDDLLDFVYGPDGVGREVVGFSDNAKLARGKLRDIQMMLKGPEMFNLGVLTGPDMSLLEAVSGSDPTSVLYHDMNRRQLEDLKRRIINNYRARARQSGYIERELGGAPVGTGIDEGAPVH